MITLAICLAVIVSLFKHYLFSFQRFTLEIARKNGTDSSDVTTLQVMMSPVILGAMGWLCWIFLLAAAGFLAVTFKWWCAPLYLILDILISAFLPLFPLKSHFAGMACAAVRRANADSQLTARLVIDIIRAGARHAI